MRKYAVEFSDEAVADLDSSFEWGCKSWGVEQASTWYVEISAEIIDRLSLSPLGYPLAPDNHEYELEVRQLVIGRYHIIYNITGRRVFILNIRGAYR